MNAEATWPAAPELRWIKSSYSGGDGGECLEVAHSPAAVHVRDSKNVRRPHLTVGRDGWARFVRYAAGS